MQQRRVKSRVAGNEVEYKSLTIPLGQKCRAPHPSPHPPLEQILFFFLYTRLVYTYFRTYVYTMWSNLILFYISGNLIKNLFE